MRKLGFKLVEAGLAEPDGAISDHTGDGSADAVMTVTVVGNGFFHAFRSFDIRAADGEELVDAGAGDSGDHFEEGGVGGGGWVFRRRVEEMLAADRGHPGYDLHTKCLVKVFVGDGSCGYAADCFSGTASPAATAGFDAVFVEVGVVCMARPGVHVHGVASIIFWSVVFIPYH